MDWLVLVFEAEGQNKDVKEKVVSLVCNHPP